MERRVWLREKGQDRIIIYVKVKVKVLEGGWRLGRLTTDRVKQAQIAIPDVAYCV